ncbi:hypothetical protein Fmac_025663 [Flemingia macrophylla]|uniref:F-box protein n=1 Tax=Flemingia macrophylla TaxID=520843 RepID=A0ABD1LSX4_9FABA
MNVRVHVKGDSCWKHVLTCPALAFLGRDGASLSGTVNWLAVPTLGSFLFTIAINVFVIFSYDLKNQTYRYLSLPSCLSEVPRYPPALRVVNGRLCLCHHHGRTQFSFWLMTEFGVQKSWTHMFKISYEQLRIHGYIYGFPRHPVILCVSENDDVVLLANGLPGVLILYNRRDNKADIYGDPYEKRYLEMEDLLPDKVVSVDLHCGVPAPFPHTSRNLSLSLPPPPPLPPQASLGLFREER